MERAMGIEPTSEAWEARNKKLETPDLAALSRSGPKPKDEPSKTRLYRNWRRRRPRGTRLTTGVFFFFQAEDGIRDGRVTGVQTCALPISGAASARCSSRSRARS